MAAFLKFRPTYGAMTTAEIIARLDRETTLRRRASGRPTLVCRWQQDADGRLSCYWEVTHADIPVPPH